MRDSRFTITLLSLMFLMACGTAPQQSKELPAALPVRFTDVTAEANIHFQHNSGKEGKKWLPETLGPGCAFFDADGDGWLDILIVNGKSWTGHGSHTTAALYKNDQHGHYIYITALEGDRLFHNEGGGHFRDVTADAGIHNANFGTSAAWLDYDQDGKLDLFVANYVQWTPEADLWCSMDGSTKSYCTPESYKGTSSKLYRNL